MVVRDFVLCQRRCASSSGLNVAFGALEGHGVVEYPGDPRGAARRSCDLAASVLSEAQGPDPCREACSEPRRRGHAVVSAAVKVAGPASLEGCGSQSERVEEPEARRVPEAAKCRTTGESHDPVDRCLDRKPWNRAARAPQRCSSTGAETREDPRTERPDPDGRHAVDARESPALLPTAHRQADRGHAGIARRRRCRAPRARYRDASDCQYRSHFPHHGCLLGTACVKHAPSSKECPNPIARRVTAHTTSAGPPAALLYPSPAASESCSPRTISSTHTPTQPPIPAPMGTPATSASTPMKASCPSPLSSPR
jgi:hypothetical protein